MGRWGSKRLELVVLAAGGLLLLVVMFLTIPLGIPYLGIGDKISEPDRRNLDPSTATSAADQESLARSNPGFLYGRVVTDDGVIHEGRLRWGGGEEAFWGDYFGGTKAGNLWADKVPPEGLATGRQPFRILGREFGGGAKIDLTRPFLARFGDIARIDAPSALVVRVTLKSGTVYDTDYLESSDFADGVRVWQGPDVGDVLDFGPRQIRSIEFLPTAKLTSSPTRLYGRIARS